MSQPVTGDGSSSEAFQAQFRYPYLPSLDLFCTNCDSLAQLLKLLFLDEQLKSFVNDLVNV